MRRTFISVSLFLALCMNAQRTDSLHVRKGITHAVLTSSAVGSLVALNQVWYAPYSSEEFHLFNDLVLLMLWYDRKFWEAPMRNNS